MGHGPHGPHGVWGVVVFGANRSNRRFGTVWDLWDAKGSKLGAHEARCRARISALLLLQVPRLVCRAGEFCWLLCALWQLCLGKQFCQALFLFC